MQCCSCIVWAHQICAGECRCSSEPGLCSGVRSWAPGYTLDLESRAKGVFLQMLEQWFFAVKCSDQEQWKILAIFLSCMKMCQAKNRWVWGTACGCLGFGLPPIPALVGAEWPALMSAAFAALNFLPQSQSCRVAHARISLRNVLWGN